MNRWIRRVAVYLETHCNIGSKSAFPTGILHRWHNCLLIYWRRSCLVPAFDDAYCHVPATEWCHCQRYVPCYLFSVSNSVRFSLIYCSLGRTKNGPHQRCSVLLFLIRNIGHRTMREIWVGTFLPVRSIQPGEKLWNDSNGKNGN